MKMNRIMAIAEKDFKEFMRNMMLLTMPILPIVMTVIFSKTPLAGEEDTRLAILMIAICLGAVLTGTIMTMIAEEKEKNTLRGLVNSPASMMDILIGKSLVVSFFTIITISVCLMILNVSVLTNIKMIIGLILLFLFFLFTGIAISLAVKNVSETSLYYLPVLFIFAMAPTFSNVGLDKNNIFVKLNNYSPASQYDLLARSSDIKHILIIGIWTLISFITTAYLFKKNSID
ncbi:ABC-type transport system involved in multi-copper enzyme maturation, permease component [Macrococcoides caseolyticum]|uniref:ABC transporter permease subunit n=1 Tax=Macrococcoides caseolyticum TaxID=69966 RepID=UPI000E0442E4|nr:ABC transporter permease subunit [Macrococcus caseolyticus]STY74594.1 ABC-type transport system involved in multi-copper enzyme maturation, permease component [Macrococcus caseolyticus]